MSDLRIAHLTPRSAGANLINQYKIIDEFLRNHFGKNIIINEVSTKEKDLEQELAKLKTENEKLKKALIKSDRYLRQGYQYIAVADMRDFGMLLLDIKDLKNE